MDRRSFLSTLAGGCVAAVCPSRPVPKVITITGRSAMAMTLLTPDVSNGLIWTVEMSRAEFARRYPSLRPALESGGRDG